jgi:hypothetical protein
MVGEGEGSKNLLCFQPKVPKIEEEIGLLPCSISTWYIYSGDGLDGDV